MAGDADVGFLAIEPAREAVLRFTGPYAAIEGVYVVPRDSDVTRPGDLDRAGRRVGVKRGSAYDLFLTRTLRHPEVVRGSEGVETRRGGAGRWCRNPRPVTEWAEAHRGHRVVDEAFMEIRQAVAHDLDHGAATAAYVHAFVDEMKASGFVADALRRSGRRDAWVAPAT